jgi:hypothetical protein
VERLTISLDRELASSLETMQEETGESKANLIRRALRTFVTRTSPHAGRPTERDLRIWTHLLATREHVIMDVSHAKLLFGHLENAPQSFWDELRQIGREHGSQYRDKGMFAVTDMLEVMESANWFLVSPESDHSWALVFTEPSSRPFVQTFLEGFYEDHPARVEIVEERTKLRVRARAAISGGRATRGVA